MEAILRSMVAIRTRCWLRRLNWRAAASSNRTITQMAEKGNELQQPIIIRHLLHDVLCRVDECQPTAHLFLNTYCAGSEWLIASRLHSRHQVGTLAAVGVAKNINVVGVQEHHRFAR